MSIDFTQERLQSCLESNYLGDGTLYAELFDGQYLSDNSSKDKILKWDGHRWAPDTLKRHQKDVEAVAQAYVRLIAMYEDVRAKLGPDDAARSKEILRQIKEVRRRVDRLRSEAGANSCCNYAWFRIENPLAITGSELDQNPDLLCFTNGVLDFRTGEFRNGRRRDYITKCTNRAFPGWNADKPKLILQFLWDIFEDEDVIKLTKQWFGYCLSGHKHLQKMAIWCGSGGNGKSVLVDIFMAALGDYGADVPSELLLDSGRVADAGAHGAHLGQLRGLHAAFLQEIDDGKKLSGSRTKSLTGSSTVTFRPPYGTDYITYPVKCKPNLVVNPLPKINGVDGALLRRLFILFFKFLFKHNPKGPLEKLRDDKLFPRLLAEIELLYPIVIEEGMEAIADGLAIPSTCTEFLQEYADDNNPVGEWMKVNTVPAPDRYVEAQDAYDNFCTWWEETRKSKPWSISLFGKHLASQEGVRKVRGNTARYYDIALTDVRGF
jgi:putative DNA primase/helicase